MKTNGSKGKKKGVVVGKDTSHGEVYFKDDGRCHITGFGVKGAVVNSPVPLAVKIVKLPKSRR